MFPEAIWLPVKLADSAVAIYETRRAEALLAELGQIADLPDVVSTDLARVRADHLASLGETEAARREYERLAARQPDAPTPEFRLAQLELRAGAAGPAAARLEHLVLRSPDVARYRRALATAALQMGDAALYLRQARYAVAVDFGA